MQKDVIYIDVEDDITAIIGKVKNSKEKIVALVPPKRIGVLQSAVNLRLLARAADGGHKHLVLITNNAALTALSAAAKIPIAKNLQSKPELAEIPVLDVDDGEDIIDGSQLSVGELAKTADKAKTPSGDVSDQMLASIENDDTATLASPPKPGELPARARVKSGIKVPSFNLFRKKLFIFGGLGALAVIFLVWAIFFAPRATVVITARTTPTGVNTSVAVGATLATSAETGMLKSIVQTDKETSSVSFDATGTQDVGDKATGTVTFRNCVTPTAQTVNAGTYISVGGKNYVVQSTVVVPGASGNFLTGCTAAGVSGPVAVTATDIGDDYNTAANTNFTVEASQMTANSANGITGGTKRTIKVVTQADVTTATTQLNAQNSDAIKKKLVAKFDNNTVVIDDSFQTSPITPVSSPDIGKESTDGKAKLTSDITYTMTGITKGDLNQYLKAAFEKQLDKDQQRVYDDGIDKVKLTGYTQTASTNTVTLNATGQVGPMIDDNAIKNQVKGKQFGDIQSELKQIQGVSDANTQFWPFWVSSVPNDVNKIKIEFKLQNGS